MPKRLKTDPLTIAAIREMRALGRTNREIADAIGWSLYRVVREVGYLIRSGQLPRRSLNGVPLNEEWSDEDSRIAVNAAVRRHDRGPRTLEAIARETGLTTSRTLAILRDLEGVLIRRTGGLWEANEDRSEPEEIVRRKKPRRKSPC